MMKTTSLTQNKSFQWSFGVHAGLLLLAFLPFAHRVINVEPKEYLVEIAYQEIPEIIESGSEGLQAQSPVFNEEPEPTTDKATEQPVPVEETEPEEVTTVAEEVSDVVSDVVTESETEVTAAESNGNGSDAETHADGGGEGSPIEGNQSGAATAGDGGGGDGLEGDGIITRKVIYREDISRAAKVNGRVTLNICINRQGRVEYAAYDPEKTTITDKEVIKEATYLALKYRFESNYSAPKRECGQLTFIFSIEDQNINLMPGFIDTY